MKTSVISILALAAAASATKYSTYYETETVTITSCEPYVTKCAYHESTKVHTKTKECDDDKSYPTPAVSSYPAKVTTTKGYEVTTTQKAYTTTPAVYETPKKDEYTISTIYETKTYTITSCPAYVKDCPVGHVTSTIVASTTYCPITYPTKPVDVVYPSKSAVVYSSKPVEPVYSPKPVEPVYSSKSAVVYATKPVEPVYPTTVKTVYPTGAPVATTYKPKNGTVTYEGAATAQRAGGLLLAVGVAAVALL